jgi:hypothetical protein
MNTEPDILIVGGGIAGVSAAVAASRKGLSVMMLEKNNFPGGKATAAYVGTVCGLYLTGPGNPRSVVSGFPMSFAGQLLQTGNSSICTHADRLHFISYLLEDFAAVCNRFLTNGSVDVHLNAVVEQAQTDNNRVVEVTCRNNHDQFTIWPRCVIDTGGEALIGQLTGGGVLAGDRYQAAAQVFALSGLPDESSGTVSLALGRCISSGINNKHLPEGLRRVSLVPGSLRRGKALFKIGIPLQVTGQRDQEELIHRFGRNAVQTIHDYLKSHSSLFRDTKVDHIAAEAGIRTGPRNRGACVLSGKDVLECRKFPDAVARGTWPVEYWEPGKNVEMTWFSDHDYYEIPSGCLTSDRLENLFFGGRHISADDKAIASARVIGTCMQTGYAAGALAAGKALEVDTNLTVQQIQHELFI